jgi:hypothetical protein
MLILKLLIAQAEEDLLKLNMQKKLFKLFIQNQKLV